MILNKEELNEYIEARLIELGGNYQDPDNIPDDVAERMDELKLLQKHFNDHI